MDATAAKTNRDTGAPRGSRVFGDCDRLFMQIMKHVLSGEALTQWEEGRAERMEAYGSKRQDNN